MTRHIVVMGVSGCGKTTIAARLADRLGYQYGEADAFHPKANVDKMAAGHPLNDDDRWPWLEKLATWMRLQQRGGVSTVLACSALKRSYRDILRAGPTGVVEFIHLEGPAEVIQRRMAAREHFMPVSLLQSQFETLEPLGDGEAGLRLSLMLDPDQLTERSMEWLQQSEASLRRVSDA